MANRRLNVPRRMKRELRKQAGGKCANPGCSSIRTEIHHIREWAVYQTHDEAHMIAICPICHDSVHHGDLRITDETIYRWKGIPRDTLKRGHLYIEPQQNAAVQFGTNRFIGPEDGFFAFQLSPRNTVSIRVLDEEILLLSLTLSNLAGEEIISFRDNHWKQLHRDLVTLSQTPGHIRITTLAAPEFLPAWVGKGIPSTEPTYPPEGDLVLLDIEVMEPGNVRMEGLWVEGHIAVVATRHGLYAVGHGATGESRAATMSNSVFDLSKNGVQSPTVLRIVFPNRNLDEMVVRIGYSEDEVVPTSRRESL